MVFSTNKSTFNRFGQSGQALVIVLLSLAVVLTLVLFVLARSTTDIAVSSRSEESIRAFSAAEAGVENALVVGVGSGTLTNPIGIGNNAAYFSNVSSFASGVSEYAYPIKLSSGESMTTWFVSHNSDGTINAKDFTGNAMTVCWGEGTPASQQNSPAIEVSIFYEATPGNPATVRIARVALDPLTGASRTSPNNFTPADTGGGCSIDGQDFSFSQAITFSDLNAVSAGLLFARVRMFYNSVPQPVGIRVEGGLLPSQGQDISSTGTAGDANRKVNVFQAWPEPPGIFDFAIYSGTGLTK